jgi:hypothetical protein
MIFGQPRWDHLRVWAYVPPSVRALEKADGLAALFRWRSGQAEAYVWFLKGVEELTRPADVDWTEFPEDQAREAAAGWRR